MAGKRATYEFHPRGTDAWYPGDHHPLPGTRVRLAQNRPDGFRSAGKGARLVEGADAGEFIGAVKTDSLRRITRLVPTISSDPSSDAVMNSVMRDRRKGQ
jgi:hypothetical protein